MNLCYKSLLIAGISNNGIIYCAMLTVEYGDISEFQTHIQIHLSAQVPQYWPNSHFPEVIQVHIYLHKY